MRTLIDDITILADIPVLLPVTSFPVGLYVTVHDTRIGHTTCFGPGRSDVCHLEAAVRASIGSLGSFPLPHEPDNAPHRDYTIILAP